MDTPQQSGRSPADASPRIVKTFICYRRDDASFAAQWLHALLDQHVYSDRNGASCQLEVYFDQAEPGVANWKSHHAPALETAAAFLVVCSHGLAVDFTKGGTIDWAHRELGTWIDNRGAAPIVIDLTENERWIPERIRKRWPDLNRLRVDPDDMRRNAPKSNSEYSEGLRQRIVNTVIESEHATTYEELARTRRTNIRLRLVSALAALACAATVFAWWRAEVSEQIAETQKEVSRQTTGFLTTLFSGADPDSLFGDSLTVKQLLKAAPATIETQSSPILKASLLRAMGSAYTGAGDSAAALHSLKRAEEILKSAHVDGEDEFRVQHSLGEAYLYTDEEFETALTHLERADALADSNGIDKSERASAKITLGDYFAWATPPQRDKARLLYQDALAIDREGDPDWLAVGRDFNRLGNLAHDAQQNSEARNNFLSALDAVKKLPAGANLLFTAQYEHDFAAVLFEDGALSEALDRYSKASESFKAAYGEDSVEHGIAENNTARILFELDRIDDAATRVTRAVEIESAAEGPKFSGLAFAFNTRALTLCAAGKLAEARQQFEKAVEVAQENEMAIVAQSLVHLAELQLTSGDPKEAGKFLADADEQFNSYGIASGWRYALYESALGELRTRECKLESARDLLSRSGETLARRWPTGNFFTRRADVRLRVFQEAGGTAACRATR
jgi:tetratricopeptide (TPR) repeat protein